MPATIGRCRKENESRAIVLRSRPSLALARRRAATSATTSKYSHHCAAATPMPSTAAATTPASTSAPAPTPMATIDSPRAMMMISPWRSAKCSGTSFQPSWPISSGPPKSSASASAHSPPCSVPSVNAAATSRPTPTLVLPASPQTDLRSAGRSKLAMMNSAMCAARTTP